MPVRINVRRVSRNVRLFGLLLVALSASACATAGGPAAPAGEPASTVLLISIDGFRADYLDREITPNLAALASRGVRAEALIPSFPTKTFPNHFSIITGLTPDHHGIVANSIWDPVMELRYSIGDREAVRNPDWYGGEPVWVTAEKAGMQTAPLFWPGSEAPISGVLPTHWMAYDGDMSHQARVDWIVNRLAPGGQRSVRFASIYFDDVDTQGHTFGPNAPETSRAVARVDSTIGVLMQELSVHGLEYVNVIVVSDHGMSQTSTDRVILLDDYLDPASVRIADWNPVLAIWPTEGDADRVLGVLTGAHPHLQVYRKADLPAELGFGTHLRAAPIIGIADPGWSITSSEYFSRNPERFNGGAHGYDNHSADMRALFIAAGPDFRESVVTAAFPNVDVYELIMAILDLPPEPGDGDLSRVSHLLR